MIRKLLFFFLFLNIPIALATNQPHSNFSKNFFSTQVDKLVLYNNGSIYLKGFDGQGIVEIYSIIGNKIYAFELQSLNDIALSYPLKSGNMYIIRVITTKKAETFKIVA